MFWCLECDQDAEARCVEDHVLCNLKKGRLQKAEGRLRDCGLGCGAAVLPALLKQLHVVRSETSSLEEQLDSAEALLAERSSRASAALESFDVALEAPGVGWEDALTALEEEWKARSPALCNLRDALQVLTMEEPEVSVGSPRVGTWTGRLELSGGELGALRLALCRLLLDGHLTRGHAPADGKCASCKAQPLQNDGHFHKNLGGDNNSELQRQHPNPKASKTVRSLPGWGSYGGGKLAVLCKEAVWPVQDAWQSVSQGLRENVDTVEGISFHIARSLRRSCGRGMKGLKSKALPKIP